MTRDSRAGHRSKPSSRLELQERFCWLPATSVQAGWPSARDHALEISTAACEIAAQAFELFPARTNPRRRRSLGRICCYRAGSRGRAARYGAGAAATAPRSLGFAPISVSSAISAPAHRALRSSTSGNSRPKPSASAAHPLAVAESDACRPGPVRRCDCPRRRRRPSSSSDSLERSLAHVSNRAGRARRRRTPLGR